MSIINTKKEDLDISDAEIIVEKEMKTDIIDKNVTENNVSNDLGILKREVKKIYKERNKPEPKEKWEDLDAIYNECAKGIISVAESVNDYVGNLREYPSEFINNETSTAVSSLAKDLEVFTKDLLYIRSRYQNKSGVIRTDQEHALSVNIALDYMNFNDRFMAITSEPLIILTEQLLEIKDRYKTNKEVIEKQDIPETKQDAEGEVSE